VDQVLRKVRIIALSAFGAFIVSGPLQYVGVLPQTAMGDASKAAIKAVLNVGTQEAFASCGGGSGGTGGGGGGGVGGGGGGGSVGGGGPQGNNGFGNGGNDGVPGNSGFPDGNR
jgi:hypothetical protein